MKITDHEESAVPPPLEDSEDEEDAVEEEEAEERDEQVEAEAKQAIEKLRSTRKDEAPTLLEEMQAASEAAKAVKAKRQAEEERKLNETFGDGLKKAMQANLAKRKERQATIESLKHQGNECFKQGNLQEAAEFYSKAIRHCGEKESWFSGEKMLHTNLSLVLTKLGRNGEAVKAADHAINLDVKWAKAYLWKARALHAMGDTKSGSRCLEKGISSVGAGSKEGRTLRSEYASLFPQAFAIYDMPTIGQTKAKENTPNDQNQFRFPQVQEAMKVLQGGEWATENFAQLVASNPILSKGLQDPRGQVLLRKIQENPRAAVAEYEKNPEAMAFINEMFKVLGTHFTQMGEDQEKRLMEENKPAIMSKEEAELQKQVEKTLKNEDLKKLLMDPQTHKVLQECGNPAALAKYMRDPVWGARLRMMMDNGLVKLES